MGLNENILKNLIVVVLLWGSELFKIPIHVSFKVFGSEFSQSEWWKNID